ncbi:MAG: YqkE family protein [Lachnospiraceae bacterium]|nr:YqkE family protein [Lachnospiraceae bacterium]
MKGSITIFLSLCLSVCFLFIGTALESARCVMLENQLQSGTEAALDSLLSRYDGDLFDEFGILLLNQKDLPGFYSLDELVMEALEYQLDIGTGRFLMQGNFLLEAAKEVRVIEVVSVTARDGDLFCRSILESMKYQIPAELAQEVLEQLQLMKDGERAGEENQEDQKQGEKQALEELDKEWNEELNNTYEEVLEESILNEVEEARKKGVLAFVLPPGYPLSGKQDNMGSFPSTDTTVDEGTFEGILSDPLNNLMVCEYALMHFDDVMDPGRNPVLQYELEYIICGQESDRKNLEGTLNQLLLLREGMNVLTICRSEWLTAQAEAAAGVLAGWTGLPPLVEAAKAAVIAAWAYGESITDIRTLIGGNPVPLYKQEKEWCLSLDGLPSLIRGEWTGAGCYEEGLSYQEYLRLFLFLTGEEEKMYRMMDMIQCRMRSYKPEFRMKDCVYSITVEVETEANQIFPVLYGGQMRTGGSYRLQSSASARY